MLTYIQHAYVHTYKHKACQQFGWANYYINLSILIAHIIKPERPQLRPLRAPSKDEVLLYGVYDMFLIHFSLQGFIRGWGVGSGGGIHTSHLARVLLTCSAFVCQYAHHDNTVCRPPFDKLSKWI